MDSDDEGVAFCMSCFNQYAPAPVPGGCARPGILRMACVHPTTGLCY
jgi:hypothetical protein